MTLKQGLILGLAFFVSIVGYYLAKLIIAKILIPIISKTKNSWDDKIVESKVFDRLLLLVPIVIFSYFVHFFPIFLQGAVLKALGALGTFILLLSFDKLLNAILLIYNSYEISHDKPIKGYLQLIKIIVYILGIIVAVCVLLGISPIGPLSTIGAATAVLMLVFKDTILSFVASIQITTNDLFKVGDWIEISSLGVDGTVIDIALHSVKVQNFDKTIINVPTFKFLDISFKNWKGMETSGGRRIKRQILIDLNSIRFLSEQDLQNMAKIDLLKDYMASKTNVNAPSEHLLNSRQLTNIGTYRAYINAYLNAHDKIHKGDNFTFLIRQLQATSKGLPIEIYVFANDNRWVEFEHIQSDIFDHLLVSAALFDLRLYQEPTGVLG